jgi:hypothetical protein
MRVQEGAMSRIVDLNQQVNTSPYRWFWRCRLHRLFLERWQPREGVRPQ